MIIQKKISIIFLIIFFISSIAKDSNAREGYADILEPLLPAVVNISIIQKNDSANQGLFNPFSKNSALKDFNQFFEQDDQIPEIDNEDKKSNKSTSAGSGFIISSEGYIVTNYHVIEQAEKITVILSNDQKIEAKLIGSDSHSDIALLKIESKAPLPFVKFANSDESRIGDFVLTIGNPFGLGSTVTSGIISAKARDINTNSSNIIDNFIQTDAAINLGNSGGPMFNLKGEVIGINFAIVSPTGNNIGIGFALPSSSAYPIIEQLIKTGKVHHGWLGISVQSTEDVAEGLGLEDGIGALVSNVSDGPAKQAGIQAGDIILKFDGKEVTDRRKLPKIVASTPIGKKVKIEMMSKGKHKNIALTISEVENNSPIINLKKEKNSKKLYGMSLSSITPNSKSDNKNKNTGILVFNITPKSIAARHGIKRNDIIHAINQQKVTNPNELFQIIQEAKNLNRKSIMLQIYRTGGNVFLSIPIIDNP